MFRAHGVLGTALLLSVIGCGSDATGVSANPSPVPALTSISPDTALAGSSMVQIMVIGSGFDSRSRIAWGASTLSTTFDDSTHIVGLIPAASLTVAESISVTVATPPPGGGISATRPFLVLPAIPHIDSLSRDTATATIATFPARILGHGFATNATVQINGVNHTATFVSAGRLDFSVLQADVAVPGDRTILVRNPGPGRIADDSAKFHVFPAPPVPTISAVSPDSVITTPGSVAIHVSGTGFTERTFALVGPDTAESNFLADTSLLVTMPPGTAANALTTYSVTLVTPAPGGGRSNAWPVPVWNPVPHLTSISPDTAFADSATYVFTFKGSGFVQGSGVQWGYPNPTVHFVDSTTLQVTALRSVLYAAGVTNARVVTGYRGGVSDSVPLHVLALRPHIDSVTPTVDSVNSDNPEVVVWGEHFDPAAQVWTSGTTRSFADATLSLGVAILPPALLGQPDTVRIAVINPAPGGASDTLEVAIVPANPTPVVDSLVPAAAYTGQGADTIIAYGSQFTPGTTVQQDDQTGSYPPLPPQIFPTDFLGANSIRFILPDSLFHTARKLPIKFVPLVPTPGAAARYYPVWTPGVETIDSIPLAATDLLSDTTRSFIYAAVHDSASDRIVRIDPATRAVTATVLLPSAAGHMAISADGSYLYVPLLTAQTILRIALASFTADDTIPVGPSSRDGTFVPAAVVVSPIASETIAVIMSYGPSFPTFPIAVAVFDGATRRPALWSTWGEPSAITFGASGDTIYAIGGGSGPALRYSLALDSTGIAAVDSTNIVGAAPGPFGVEQSVAAGGLLLLDQGTLYDLAGATESSIGSSGPVAAQINGDAFYQIVGEYLNPIVTIKRLNTSGSVTDSASFPGDATGLSALTRWGSDGLAIATSGAKIYFVRAIQVH